MSNEYILEDEFWDDWGVIQKWDGGMFDHADVKDKPLEHVWTIVDTGAYEDENWYAMPGLHIVNTLGYIMTRRAWTSDTPDAIYFLHEDEDDGERQVFIYQYRDASNYKASGMLLLYGASRDVEEDLIRECCDADGCFVAEQVGVPALCNQLFTFGGGPTDDDHAFHEFRAFAQPRQKNLLRYHCGVVYEI